MINQPVMLSEELKAYLEQQDIYFYPQFGEYRSPCEVQRNTGFMAV